jgi:hypothetical protein
MHRSSDTITGASAALAGHQRMRERRNPRWRAGDACPFRPRGAVRRGGSRKCKKCRKCKKRRVQWLGQVSAGLQKLAKNAEIHQ